MHEWRKELCPEFLSLKSKKMVHSFPKDVDKKIYILDKITKLYPSLDWGYKRTGSHKDGNFDMADAIGIGLGFFVKKQKISLN